LSKNEGLLKERILLIAGKGSLAPLLSPVEVGKKIGDIIGGVFEILDEAKKDLMAGFPNNPFLKEALQKIAKEDKDNFYAGMFVKLEKWFGEAEIVKLSK